MRKTAKAPQGYFCEIREGKTSNFSAISSCEETLAEDKYINRLVIAGRKGIPGE
jgi:hypothetical protein